MMREGLLSRLLPMLASLLISQQTVAQIIDLS